MKKILTSLGVAILACCSFGFNSGQTMANISQEEAIEQANESVSLKNICKTKNENYCTLNEYFTFINLLDENEEVVCENEDEYIPRIDEKTKSEAIEIMQKKFGDYINDHYEGSVEYLLLCESDFVEFFCKEQGISLEEWKSAVKKSLEESKGKEFFNKNFDAKTLNEKDLYGALCKTLEKEVLHLTKKFFKTLAKNLKTQPKTLLKNLKSAQQQVDEVFNSMSKSCHDMLNGKNI